jgi:hypothetical protein
MFATIRSDTFWFSAMPYFHGDNTGSNPVGDANRIKILDALLVRVVLSYGAKANVLRADQLIMRLQLRRRARRSL